jgi:hypothetical protein
VICPTACFTSPQVGYESISSKAAAHGIHRNDSPWDIVIFGVIGVALLALLPAKQLSPAPISEPRFAER